MPLAYPKIRDDLIYSRTEEDDDVVFYVKDPLRNQFFRFNELQVAMMQLFDGKRGFHEIVEDVSNQFEQEIPEDSVPRFVQRLERMYLLDVTCYQVTPGKATQKITALLKKRGLIWRELGRKRDEAATPAQTMFDQGVKRLDAGDPLGAAGFFSAVLELQPENERARAILRTIQEGFFKALSTVPSGLRILFNFNPDRLLGVLDKVLGKIFFGRRALVMLLVIFVLGFAMAVDLRLSDRQDTVWDWLFGYGFFVVALFVHEASHGLACRHYGGHVNEIGVMTMFGFLLAPYCDVSESYLFKDRRHKVAVQLAGVTGQLVFYFCALALCYFTPESFWFRKVLIETMLLTSIHMWQNLMPLVRFDGYYALADWLEVPNLRERAFAYLRESLKRSLLGIDVELPPATPRERKILLIYAVLGAVYTAFYVLVLWLQLLVPFLLRTLHALGVVIVVVSGVSVLVLPLIRGLVKLSFLLYANRRRVFTPLRTASFALVAGALVFGLSYPWPLLIDGEMVVRPAERRQVAALEDGLVDQLLVRDGDQVHAGQTVAKLINRDLERERIDTAALLDKATHELRLVQSGARHEEVQAAEARRKRSTVEKRYADLQEGREEVLAAAHLRSDDDELRAREAATAAQGNVEVASLSLKLLRSGAREEDIEEAQASVRKLTARLQELDERLSRLVVTSPIDGTIVQPHLEEARGRRLARGDKLCEVQDLSRIEAEIRLPPTEPMAQLKPGERVALRAKGDPHHILYAQVSAIQPREGPSFAVVHTDAIANVLKWPSGLSGHARIYAPHRSIAYVLFGVPLVQVWDYRTWVFWG